MRKSSRCMISFFLFEAESWNFESKYSWQITSGVLNCVNFSISCTKYILKLWFRPTQWCCFCPHTPPLELTRGWPKRQFLHVTVIFKQQFTLFITFSLFFRSRTSPTSWPGRGGKGQIMVQKKECLCVFHQVLATMCDEELNYCC